MNKSQSIKWGMVLAAGLGSRLYPITNRMPKPLMKVGGISGLDHAIKNLQMVGVENIIVNCHHQSEIMQQHLRDKGVYLLYEPQLLETGGSIMNAMQHFAISEMLVVNPDVILLAEDKPVMMDLVKNWNPKDMELLLLVQHHKQLPQADIKSGDFYLKDGGRFTFDPLDRGPYYFLGSYIVKNSVFRDRDSISKFSMLEYIKLNNPQNYLQHPYFCTEYTGVALNIDNLKLLADAALFMQRSLGKLS